MKAIVNTILVLKELKKFSNIINKNTILPILENIHLEFRKDSLIMTATDLETTLVSNVKCDCNNPFTTLLNFGDLVKIFNSIPDQPITIEKKGKVVTLLADDSKFRLPEGGDLDTFPKIPDDNYLFSMEVGEDFISGIYNANACKNKNNLIVNQNTACLDFKKDVLCIVGTDASLLFKKDLAIKTKLPKKTLTPEKFVQNIKGYDQGSLSIGEKFAKFEHNGTSIISRLQDNDYVSYEVILPKDPIYNLTVNRTDFIHAINRALATANSINILAIGFGNNELKITSEDVDFEKSGEVRVRAIHTAEIDSIGVNGGQLLHLLGLIDSEEVQFAIRGKQKTIYLKPVGDETVLCLLQPLMI